jgi:cephalosporin hydroxylase
MLTNRLDAYTKKLFIQIYNKIVLFKTPSYPIQSGSKDIDEIVEKSLIPTDIADHLISLFKAGMETQPKFIMELGVRSGESTYVFDKIARHFKSFFVSLDIDNCASVINNPDWVFIQGDDIEFANQFRTWQKQKNIDVDIDLLFIDTSHLYEHTVAEIESFFPLIANNGIVIFHDTNMHKVCYKKNGSIYKFLKNPHRGVIRALETYFETHFNETNDFIDYRKGWLINHVAHCNGLTILKRINSISHPSE